MDGRWLKVASDTHQTKSYYFQAWLLYGIYQIGYTIEDPFQGSLRLTILSEAIYRDVMEGSHYMDRRRTAFETPTYDDDNITAEDHNDTGGRTDDEATVNKAGNQDLKENEFRP